jgi:hypothetical protein
MRAPHRGGGRGRSVVGTASLVATAAMLHLSSFFCERWPRDRLPMSAELRVSHHCGRGVFLGAAAAVTGPAGLEWAILDRGRPWMVASVYEPQSLHRNKVHPRAVAASIRTAVT